MTLQEALACGPLIGDGAMGTQLQQAGLEPGACGELWNVRHPDIIVSIHRTYVEAGARLITTNTFGANRIALARHDAAASVTAVNRAGVTLARQAAGGNAWVIGDIGPFGGLLAPLGEHDPDDVDAAFREQADALLQAGADAILIETMAAIDEMQIAIRAARAAGAALVMATMSFERTRVGPRTLMGESPEQAARAMQAAGAAIIGTNCGALELGDYVDIARMLHAAAPSLPIMVQPNAGQPRLLDSGGIQYPATPSDMAALVQPLREAGASLIGGCCGTTPAHIRALSAASGVPA